MLSIKPKYANLILAKSKRVEFRRAWATQDVSVIVLYSSSPIQKIVGIVKVDDVIIASPTSLWKTCTDNGGGLTRHELRTYFVGKSSGFALMLGKVFEAPKPVLPADVINDFKPPQSFRYLNDMEYQKIEKKMATRKMGA